MQHWVSMSSHTKGFLGVVIVEAHCPVDAINQVRTIAPKELEAACGVECIFLPLVESFGKQYLNRLITKPEIFTIGDSTLKDKVH